MRESHRQAAVAVLAVREGKPLPAALAESGAEEAGAARAFVHELVYGTLRHLGTLDALVDALSDRRIPDARLRSLVAVALYQLEHGRAPPFAVVDQAVSAAGEWVGAPSKRLVNALLRRFLRERDALLARVRLRPEARFSYPTWWIDRVRDDWPADYEAILDAGNARAPLALRVNARVCDRESLLARFADAGHMARAEGASGVVVDPPCPVTGLPGFGEGAFSVQDLGAQLAGVLLDAREGQHVLDACAAPGGKTSHILERASVSLVALDSDAQRLKRVGDNLARLGLARAGVALRQGDATDPGAWWDGRPFDAVLADVPCSASGVVRRHPDAKWLRRASDVDRFATLQRAILEALWGLVAPKGRLLYATCSVFAQENQARVDEFLLAHPEALHEPITLPDAVAHSGGQLLPSTNATGHNQDGFFYALLRKA